MKKLKITEFTRRELEALYDAAELLRYDLYKQMTEAKKRVLRFSYKRRINALTSAIGKIMPKDERSKQ